MKRTTFDGLVLLLPLTAVIGIISALALANPTAVVRAMLPPSAASVADPIVVAARSGQLRPHIRLASTGHSAEILSDSRPLQLGDRITISAQDGDQRVYTVRTISEIQVPLTATASESSHDATSRLLLVTCYSLDDTHARPLRFIIEDGQTSAPQQVGLSQPQPL